MNENNFAVTKLSYRQLLKYRKVLVRTKLQSIIQGCIQKFQDSTCKKKFAYFGC